MTARMLINPAYEPALASQHRYLALYGGAGSGKSVFAAQKVLLRLMNEDGHRWLIGRKVGRTIRNSQFALLRDLIGQYRLQRDWHVNKSEMGLTYKPNGNEIISAGLDDPEKIKSIAGITGEWIEETSELDPEDFNQLDLRLRGQTANYKQIVLTFNPVESFLLDRFVDQHPDNALVLRTTHLDNLFIDEEYRQVLENLKREDENLYRIYTLGLKGILKDLVYDTPWEERDSFPDPEEIIYGLDFGFTNPTALVQIGLRDQRAFLTELLYRPHLETDRLITELRRLIRPSVRQSRPIYADPSEPEKIAALRKAGFNVKPAKNDVADGIQAVKRCRPVTHRSNTNLNAERKAYKWKRDARGNVLEEPVKFKDHGMDATRYGIHSHTKRSRIKVRTVGGEYDD